MASSSSSSSSYSSRKYEVFVSFRGEDTRNGFTSHLAAALRRKQIEFFIDDEELQKGDEISPALSNAIETADISIIIFSKDYASSKWCLNELVKILDCKNMNGQIVIPVFYHVDPSDVRKQKGSFGESFVAHEQNFKVRKWRAALTEAADLSGYDSTEFRNEAELVEKIAADISKKLMEDISDSTDLDGFVGLNSQIEEIKTMLCLEMLDVRVVGLWGMGGIGKTTLASAVFRQISRKFQGRCFMEDVREETKRMGAKYVRDEVICQVLDESLKIGTPIISSEIKKRLQRMKVLIVLDDVHDDFTQLESLVRGLLESLAGSRTGSRIIITTRDKGILDKCGVNNVYKVKGLKHNQALELFCREAFRQNNRSHDLLKLSKQVVCYANGNPLALKVLGASFYPKSKQQWEDKLLNLKLISEPHIYEVLKISYDELNEGEKNIFLDIACFFRGEDIDLMRRVSTDDPTSVDTLVDKSLIKISRFRTVQMHDLLQEMGREIVHQESVKEPDKRSRLWNHKDIRHVLKQNMKALKLKSIDLSDSQYLTRMWDTSETPNLERTILSNCTKLACFPSSVQNYKHLSMLSFEGCESLRSFPNNLHFVCPVSIDFSYCENLTKFPNISGKIKNLFLNHSAIEEVPSSIECLTYLEELDLSDCIRLKRLSSSIYNLKSLQVLYLRDCLNLESFPESLEKMEHLEHMSIIELPSITELPSSITEIPQDIDYLSSLERLYLSGNNFESLPASIEHLSRLQWLPNDSMSELTSVFFFGGCLKLNETANNKILADSQLKIHHMAIASLRRFI